MIGSGQAFVGEFAKQAVIAGVTGGATEAFLAGVAEGLNGVRVVAAATEAATETATTAGRETVYLYEKVGANGEHLKYGTTKNPLTRYTQTQLGGGRLKILASGEKSEMLSLERNLHETMPIGPEEGQSFYKDIQAQKGYSVPPY
jgi:hypothetical protein